MSVKSINLPSQATVDPVPVTSVNMDMNLDMDMEMEMDVDENDMELEWDGEGADMDLESRSRTFEHEIAHPAEEPESTTMLYPMRHMGESIQSMSPSRSQIGIGVGYKTGLAATIRPTAEFDPKRAKAFLAEQLKELVEKYKDDLESPSFGCIPPLPDADMVQLRNQETYFRPYRIQDTPGFPRCVDSTDQLQGGSKSGRPKFEAQSLNQDMSLKNRNLLERIGAFNPALGLMLERPAAIVTQSAFIKRLDAQIKYEIEKCDCPAPSHLTSWLFDFVRSDNIGGDEPELTISSEPQEKLMGRFKIYQKAFTTLILHFENLRPILRDIKRTYEAALFLKAKQIREILVVKKTIEQYEKLLDTKREEIQREGYAQLNELQQQCLLLMRHVDKQDSAIRTMTEMLEQIEKCLAEENEIRLASEDQRKILIVEVNTLRRKYGFGPSPATIATLAGAAGDGPPAPNSDKTPAAATTGRFADRMDDPSILQSEDPNVLRAALENTRKTLTEAYKRITVLEADYSDVVPMEDYNVVKEQVDALKERNAETAGRYNEVTSQIQELRAQIETLMSECNEFKEIMEDLRRTPTPRPSWTKIGEHFKRLIESEDPSNTWSDVYDGNSTKVIAEKLVEHITGKRVVPTGHVHDDVPGTAGEYIKPAGIDPSRVPHYLRYNYYVVNRHFSKREAATVIQDIWNTRCEELEIYRKVKEAQEEEASGSYGYGYGIVDKKAGADAALPDELPVIHHFPDFVAHFFHHRFHLVHLRMEWTYNVIETCRKNPSELKLSHFLGTLESNIDEAAYHAYRSQVEFIRSIMIKKSEELKTPGALMADDLYELLRANFPYKTDEQIEALVEAAAKQTLNFSKTAPIKYAIFFVQTEEGWIGEFVRECAKQLQDDVKTYVYEILAELLADLGVSLYAAENAEVDPAGDTDVNMQAVYSAIVTVDPTITTEKLGAALAWIFLGESTLPGNTAKGVPLVEYVKSHLRRKAALAGAIESDEEEDHEDEDFERIVQAIQHKRHSAADAAAVDEDDESKGRHAINKLKIANLRTVMRRFKGSALLRHGPAESQTEPSRTSVHSRTSKASKQSTHAQGEKVGSTTAAATPTATDKAAAAESEEEEGDAPPPPPSQSPSAKHLTSKGKGKVTGKESVPVVDLYKRDPGTGSVAGRASAASHAGDKEGKKGKHKKK